MCFQPCSLSTKLQIELECLLPGSLKKYILVLWVAASAEKRLIPEGLKASSVVFLDSDIQTPQSTSIHISYYLNHTTID